MILGVGVLVVFLAFVAHEKNTSKQVVLGRRIICYKRRTFERRFLLNAVDYGTVCCARYPPSHKACHSLSHYFLLDISTSLVLCCLSLFRTFRQFIATEYALIGLISLVGIELSSSFVYYSIWGAQVSRVWTDRFRERKRGSLRLGVTSWTTGFIVAKTYGGTMFP